MNVVSVLALDSQFPRLQGSGRGHERLREVSQLHEPPGVHPGQLRRPGRLADDGDHHPRPLSSRGDHPGSPDQHLGVPLCRDGMQLATSSDPGGRQHRILTIGFKKGPGGTVVGGLWIGQQAGLSARLRIRREGSHGQGMSHDVHPVVTQLLGQQEQRGTIPAESWLRPCPGGAGTAGHEPRLPTRDRDAVDHQAQVGVLAGMQGGCEIELLPIGCELGLVAVGLNRCQQLRQRQAPPATQRRITTRLLLGGRGCAPHRLKPGLLVQ